MDYLKESYGGLAYNEYDDRCFYCYTIFDIEYNMFYSGYKTNNTSGIPCIGKTYFTSSTVTDFKTRFKTHPEKFKINYEFFRNAASAASAEKEFHRKHDVGRSVHFYNVINSGGSTCGAGSLLCRNNDGTIYRVSTQEYKLGHHKHVSADRMNVLDKNTGKIRKIRKSEFDASTMVTQFSNHVVCYDNEKQCSRRIPREEFYSNGNRYNGITHGTFVVHNKTTGEPVVLKAGTKYDKNIYENRGKAHTVKVYSPDGNKINISREEYKNNKSKFKHTNSLFLNRIDIITGQKRKVSREEYDNNPNQFADLNAKFYYIVDEQTFASWRKLTVHFNIGKYVSIKTAEKLIGTEIQKVEITLNEN